MSLLNESIVEDAALTWFTEQGYSVGRTPHFALFILGFRGQNHPMCFNSNAPACGSVASLPAGSRRRRVRFAQRDRALAHDGVQSENFVESHGGQLGDISIYGQNRHIDNYDDLKLSA